MSAEAASIAVGEKLLTPAFITAPDRAERLANIEPAAWPLEKQANARCLAIAVIGHRFGLSGSRCAFLIVELLVHALVDDLRHPRTDRWRRGLECCRQPKPSEPTHTLDEDMQRVG